jgi:hypothetical protein
MSELTVEVKILFRSIARAFHGKYQNENAEIKAMREEIISLEIPSIEEDRNNLVHDNTKVLKDLRKAVSSYTEKEIAES